MGGSITKCPGEAEGELSVGKTITILGKKFEVIDTNEVSAGLKQNQNHFYLYNNVVYYLKPVKGGGAAKKQPRVEKSTRGEKQPRERIKQEPVLYPEEGLHSKWSAPRKRSEKISVDGQAPVNFLTENIE